MKKLLVAALFVNALLLAGRFWQELPVDAQGGGAGPVATDNGDVNGDDTRDVSDAIFFLNWLFLGGPAPVAFAAAVSDNHCVDSIAALKALDTSQHCVQVLGYYHPGDGGGGVFWWDRGSGGRDNGGTVIASTFDPGGRWMRLLDAGSTQVMNVKAFGAQGGDNIDDTPFIREAADAIPDEGGILYFPSGEYDVVAGPRRRMEDWEPFTAGIELKDRTWVRGTGSGSVISAEGSTLVFLGLRVSQVRVSNLSFKIDVLGSTASNFTTALDFEGGADIVVDSCRFEAVNVPPGDFTLHAVLAKGVTRLRVTNNRIDQMQIKTGAGPMESGFDVMGPALIANNHITRPRNWGITAVHGSDRTEIQDLIVVNNVIEDPGGEGGIAVGTDGDRFRARSLKRILIHGNIIKGDWTRGTQGIGILVRAAEESEDISVSGNVISKEEGAPTDTIGLKVDIPTRPTRMNALIISNNLFRNHSLGGISMLGDENTSNFVISGNSFADRGGVILKRGNIRNGIIGSNVLTGNASFRVGGSMASETIGPLLVQGNVFENSSGDGVTLLTFDPDSIIQAQFIGNDVSDNGRSGVPGVPDVPGAAGVREMGEGLDTHYLFNDLRNNTGGAFSGVNPFATRLGNWSPPDSLDTPEYIRRHISATPTWPGGAVATVSVNGAQVGDTVVVAANSPSDIPAGAFLSPAVTAPNRVTVRVLTTSGGPPPSLPAGATLRVDVWRH